MPNVSPTPLDSSIQEPTDTSADSDPPNVERRTYFMYLGAVAFFSVLAMYFATSNRDPWGEYLDDYWNELVFVPIVCLFAAFAPQAIRAAARIAITGFALFSVTTMASSSDFEIQYLIAYVLGFLLLVGGTATAVRDLFRAHHRVWGALVIVLAVVGIPTAYWLMLIAAGG